MKTDTYPIPRIDDCIDRIENLKFITKLDMLKGFYQVPLTERAKEISAFVTPDGLYQYRDMPFGMKNSLATFQRLVNAIVCDIPCCDDGVIYSTWEEMHLVMIEQFFQKLSEANLTVNLTKTELVHTSATYLGHVCCFLKKFNISQRNYSALKR